MDRQFALGDSLADRHQVVDARLPLFLRDHRRLLAAGRFYPGRRRGFFDFLFRLGYDHLRRFVAGLAQAAQFFGEVLRLLALPLGVLALLAGLGVRDGLLRLRVFIHLGLGRADDQVDGVPGRFE